MFTFIQALNQIALSFMAIFGFQAVLNGRKNKNRVLNRGFEESNSLDNKLHIQIQVGGHKSVNRKLFFIQQKMKKKMLKPCPYVEKGLIKEPTFEDYSSSLTVKLGAGAFGQVYKVVHKDTGQIYALKTIQKDFLISLSQKSDNDFVQILNREIDIMYQLNHPYIVKLYCHFEDNINCYLVLEFCPNGQLFQLLQKRGKLDQKTCAQYMRELGSALDYLHSQNPPIIHRDIKPENVLLDSE